MRASRKKTQHAPFTLVEVILAVSIFAVLAALTGGILYTLPRGFESMNHVSARLTELMRMDRFADEIVRNAVNFHWRHNAESWPVFFGEKERMLLAARRRPTEENGGFLFVAVELREKQLVAQYRDKPIVVWEKEVLPETLREEILLEDVKSFRFRYLEYDPVHGKFEWYEEWPTNNEKDNVLPCAISWDVEFEDGETVHYLRRIGMQSYYSLSGKGSL